MPWSGNKSNCVNSQSWRCSPCSHGVQEQSGSQGGQQQQSHYVGSQPYRGHGNRRGQTSHSRGRGGVPADYVCRIYGGVLH